MPRGSRPSGSCAMSERIIPHSRPLLTDSDIRAVVSVLESGQLAQGPRVEEFEKALAGFIGKKEAVAVSSGSAALYLSLVALGIAEDDEVIVPSFVCSAVLNAVNLAGANAVIADIDPLTFNMSVASVREAVSNKTKAVIVPHMFGLPAELEGLSDLGVPLIEDCAQALGASYKGKKAGSFGLLSVFSFYATKVIAAGEGGMVLSDSRELASRVRDLREYDHKEDGVLRFNFKMTDIQAALGQSQLTQLDSFLRKRREVAGRYFEEFRDCHFSLPVRREGTEHIYYRFVVRAGKTASGYLEKLKEKKVICRRPVFKPLHLYLNKPGFPHSSEAWEKSISIPIYPSLKAEEVEKVVAVVREIF